MVPHTNPAAEASLSGGGPLGLVYPDDLEEVVDAAETALRRSRSGPRESSRNA